MPDLSLELIDPLECVDLEAPLVGELFLDAEDVLLHLVVHELVQFTGLVLLLSQLTQLDLLIL